MHGQICLSNLFSIKEAQAILRDSFFEHTAGDGRGVLIKLATDAPESDLVRYSLTTRNLNGLTDDDLRRIVACLDDAAAGGLLHDSSTEALVSLLADMYGLNADECLRNFQATEADPDTNCLLQDPIAEAALGPIPGAVNITL